MNDRDARRLLEGIDAPRPLPAALRAQLSGGLASGDLGLSTAGAPRPLPHDLRNRLEASLLVAHPRPLPRSLRRALLAAAAAVTVAGMVVVGGGDPDDRTRVAGGPATTVVDPPTATRAGSGAGAAADAGAAASGPAVTATTVPFDGGAGAGAGAQASAPAPEAPAAGTASADRGREAIAVTVRGGGTDVAAGFDAYLRTLDRSGGIGGRPVTTVDSPAADAVATVNLDQRPSAAPADGVLFETAFVDEARLSGTVVSLSSPIERQATLAVAAAFPERVDGASAAVYAGDGEPWASIVPAALDAALRDRGVTPVRVVFRRDAPAFVPADAAFLSLAPPEVAAYVDGAGGAPPRGTWGVGSAWDDALAAAAAPLELGVLSPYAPVGGDEQAALAEALAPRRLSTGAVHGWVTAKALAVVLARNGGEVVTEADLDALTGWDPGWAPPFETRPATRARMPDALLLRPAGDAFTPDGEFRRA